MSYKNCKVIRVVKENWDELWHVYYIKAGKETYDRVSLNDALKAVKR